MKRVLLATLLSFILLVSLLLAACGGGKADVEALATQAANVQPSRELTITARAMKFDTKTLVVAAGQEVLLHFDNQDGGAIHNVAIYRDSTVKDKVFAGELFKGREARDYKFTAPEAGVYYFRCDAHPDMDGVLIAR
jgi:plastocyanin